MRETADLAVLVEQALAGAAAMQALQSAYDEVGWRIQDPSWAKARHLLYHLLSTTAELGRIVEAVEHAQVEDVRLTGAGTDVRFRDALAAHRSLSARLVFHAAQIANLSGLNLGEELIGHYRLQARRFAPHSPLAGIGE